MGPKTEEARENESARLAVHCAEAQKTCRNEVMGEVRSRVKYSLFWKVIVSVAGTGAVLLGIVFALGRETAADVVKDGNRTTRIEAQMENQTEMVKQIYQAVVVKKP